MSVQIRMSPSKWFVKLWGEKWAVPLSETSEVFALLTKRHIGFTAREHNQRIGNDGHLAIQVEPLGATEFECETISEAMIVVEEFLDLKDKFGRVQEAEHREGYANWRNKGE